MMAQKISIDTRTIQPGDIFIPVGNGIDFCDDAIRKGATVLDVDLTEYAIEHRRKFTGTVIGITGSFGKTTLKDTLSAVLSPFKVSSTEKNFNNELGVPLTIANANLDANYWVIEMGIRKPGDMSHLANIVQADIAVLSGFGYSHMEFYSHEIDLLKEKLSIITPNTKSIFIPSNIHCKSDIYSICGKTPVIECSVPTLIETNRSICRSIAEHFNLAPSIVDHQLLHIQQSPHRLNQSILSNGTVLIDDTYNSNPISIKFAIETIQTFFSNQRILAVLGDMAELGSESDFIHKQTLDWVRSKLNSDAIITYGSKFTTSQLNTTSHDALISTIEPLIDTFDVILIKGSRVNQLDQILDRLIK